MTIVRLQRPSGPSPRLLCVSGQHDPGSVAALSADLARVIALDDNDLIVDLSAVEFMDASTVGVFLRGRAFLATRGRALRLQFPSTAARRVLDACQVAYDAVPAPAGPNLTIVGEDDGRG